MNSHIQPSFMRTVTSLIIEVALHMACQSSMTNSAFPVMAASQKQHNSSA